MSGQRRTMTPSGQRRVMKLTAIMCCMCVVAALSSVVLGTGTAGAAPTTWTVVPSPNPTNNQSLDGVSCLNNNDCTAVGVTGVNDGDQQSTLVESWDGSSWS